MVLGAMALLFMLGIGFLLFCLSALLTGQYEPTYRCVEYGIVEKASASWGVRISAWQPTSGQHCGATN